MSNANNKNGNNDKQGKPANMNNNNRNTNGNKNEPRHGKQDKEWYKVSDQVNNSIANLPFNRFPGTFEPIGNGAIATGGTAGISTINNQCPNSTPGVLALKYVCSYGGSSIYGQATATNIAAKAVYTWVRHQNSGHSNYESADLMLYIMAMDEIYSEYLELKRILTTVTKYELVNRNIPELLLEAMGMSSTARADLRDNLAQYRGRLNLSAAKISSMAVPDAFHIFKRRALLASSVFTDAESRLAQMYVFVKNGHRVYNPTLTPNGGGLEYFAQNNTTFANRLADLELMIDAVISDDDMNIMSGDILKAYGRDRLYTLAECDSSETVAILFNEDVLQQIENCIAISPDLSSGGADITQGGNLIQESYEAVANSRDVLVAAVAYLTAEIYINSHKDEVAPDDVMEYTRLMCGITYDSSLSKIKFRPGSELVVGFDMLSIVYTTSGIPSVQTRSFESFINSQASGFGFAGLGTLDKFDWHPIVYGFSHTSGSSSMSLSGVIGDLKKYTLVSSSDLAAMNDVAIMGLLGSLAVKNFAK